MNCALFNCGQTCNEHETPVASDLSCPYSGLANGLHALAQPLTVLRGALGAWKLRGAAEAGNDRYLEMSSKQVERMSDLLGCLQDLLDTPIGEPKQEALDPNELVDQVLVGMSSTLQEWGGRIDRVESDGPIAMNGDADRTEHALRAALRAAVSVSSVGGSFRLTTRLREGQVELIVDDATGAKRELTFTEKLNLGLVEKNIRCQGGDYACVESPFRMTFTLPAHDVQAVGTELVAQELCVQPGD